MNAGHSVLIYCGDAVGLGHLRRNTAIASRLVQEMPGTNVVLTTNLPTSFVFECPPGVDVVKLPSLSRDANGNFAARTLSVRQPQLKSVRSAMIEGLSQNFRPDLLLVDHLPTGVSGELTTTLDRLAMSPNQPCIVLGLRDILDDGKVTRRRWRNAGIYRTIEKRYDTVLVYGSREVFDTGHYYGLDNGLSTPVHHCGFVCSEILDQDCRPTRRDLGLGEEPLVVVTAGGGADGYPMMKKALEALRLSPPHAKVQVVCITGPLMERDQIADLRSRAADLPATVLWCVDRAPAYFDAADVVVTMAGYNTLMEAVRLKKRTIVLPRTGPSAEQTMRAQLFEQRGLVRRLDPDKNTAQALGRLVQKTLAADAPSAGLPDMDGLDRVVVRLRHMLEARATRLDLPVAGSGR